MTLGHDYDAWDARQDEWTDYVMSYVRTGDRCPECGFEGWEEHDSRPWIVRAWREFRAWIRRREFTVWLWDVSALEDEEPCPNCGWSKDDELQKAHDEARDATSWEETAQSLVMEWKADIASGVRRAGGGR